MNVFKKVATSVLQITTILIVLIFSLFIIIKSIEIILNINIINPLQDYVSVQFDVRKRSPLNEFYSIEARNADNDHMVVSNWIWGCIIPQNQSNFQFPDFLLDSLSGLYGRFPDPNSEEPIVNVHPLYVRLAHLSKSILNKRFDIDKQLSNAYQIAQIGALGSILIGLLTTIMVGLSSTEIGKQQTRIGFFIRLSALALPAFGTAIAAIIAFYDPNGNLARQSQAVAGLQQLHQQVSVATWKISCIQDIKEEIPQEVVARLDTWTLRMQELVASTGDNRVQNVAQTKAANSNKSQ